MRLYYADPAGNITAMVQSPIAPGDRVRVAKAILALGRAEQVGFLTEPLLGGDCRLEMMGGEFCGNAARSLGYLTALTRQETGVHTLAAEISGAPAPVPVTADLDRGRAWANMPLPLGVVPTEVAGRTYPTVFCPGICHLIAEQPPEEGFLAEALAVLSTYSPEAAGVMFLEGDKLTPAVYVRSTDSLVWESSCGSGSTACGWYLAQNAPDGQYTYRFREPGGVIETAVTKADGAVTRVFMGGPLALSQPVELEL